MKSHTKIISSVKRLWVIILFLLIGNFTIHEIYAQDLNDYDNSSGKMRPIVERYERDQSTINWYYDIPLSELCFNKKVNFYSDCQKEIDKIDFNSLNQDERAEYLLLKNEIKKDLYRLNLNKKLNESIFGMITFSGSIVNLEENRLKMQKINPKESAVILSDIGKKTKSLHDSIKSAIENEKKNKYVKPDKIIIDRTIRVLNELKNTLKEWYSFYNGYDPMFTWWNEEPYKKANEALEKYSTYLNDKFLKTENKDEINGEPIGREALLEELSLEMIPYSPEELIEIGKKEYLWCENEMKKTSEKLGFKDNWLKALEYVKSLHLEPGEQPYLIKDQAIESIEFLEKNNLITIPDLARESWKIEMMSPEWQRYTPFFTGGRVISVSFPTNTMTHEEKEMSMRGNNKHFTRATVHHEVIPGHYLQEFMTPRFKEYRRMFGTPFWGEGWPLYWEMLLWDLNFAKSTEDQIGMLFWRMHRAARIIFSLSFHLGRMSPQECIDFLVQKVGHEVANATGEVRRSVSGGYGPLYQCAYMLGGLQLKALQKELVATGKMTIKEFNDKVIRENSIPIEMLRAIMTNQNLSKEYIANWKFYGEVKVGK